MKKISVLFSALAILFAVAGSFASSIAPRTTVPTFINTTSTPTICDDADVVCEGGDTPCRKLVPLVGSEQDIYDWQETGCEHRLFMK